MYYFSSEGNPTSVYIGFVERVYQSLLLPNVQMWGHTLLGRGPEYYCVTPLHSVARPN